MMEGCRKNELVAYVKKHRWSIVLLAIVIGVLLTFLRWR